MTIAMVVLAAPTTATVPIKLQTKQEEKCGGKKFVNKKKNK